MDSEEDTTQTGGVNIAGTPSTNKRKLEQSEEIEINLDLPEPPSKKAKRKEKKSKTSSATKSEQTPTDRKRPVDTGSEDSDEAPTANSTKPAQTAPKRSEFSIWIGNLPFTATRESLRNFLKDEGGIEEKDVVRLHLPTTNTTNTNGSAGGKTSQNKGFAYVDFTTQEFLDKALALSEKPLNGRRVLIKNAKSFEGRPEKAKETQTTPGATNGKPPGREPTKKIFVGNLGFDVSREDLAQHFGQAGEVEDIFMATFEDSGKCKGFGWVRFSTVEAAEAAVKGFVYKKLEDDDDLEDASDEAGSDAAPVAKKERKKKRQKYFINRLHGRQLRCEFAEDAQTRYKKRFVKDPKATQVPESAPIVHAGQGTIGINNDAGNPRPPLEGTDEFGRRLRRPDKEQRREERRKRHEKLDARTIAPGRALANTKRATGAIVAGAGKKMVFDD